VSSNIRNIGFILLYLSIWFSLDTSFYNLANIQNENFLGLIKALRFISPFIIFIILALLFIKDLTLIRLNTKFKYLLFLIFITFFLQSIIPFFNENNVVHVSFSLIVIILLVNLTFFYEYFDLKKIFLIGMIVLFFITLVYGSALIHYLIFGTKNLNLYGGWPVNLEALTTISDNVPRSSGISRSSLIMMIPLGFYFLISKKLNYKFYLIYLLCSFLMLSSQSRITLFVYLLGVVIFITYIFFVHINYKFYERLKKIFTIILIPVIFWVFILELLTLNRDTPAFVEYFKDKLITNTNEIDNIDNKDKYSQLFRKTDKGSFSSRRTEDWQSIIEKNKNYFLGYGALGDRHLINQSASSLYFYNYTSGGLFAVFIFLILIFRSIYICTKIVFKIHKIPDKDNYLDLSACFIILFLIIRSIVESSFAVFGIDSLVFFTSYFYIEQSYKKNMIK
tara:strand:- start:101 stop:1450 length:1350 start_codon:yes stop_codon:yes gene_type:complete